MTQVIQARNFRATTALDAQKRKRLPTDVLEEGEYLGFDMMFADSAATQFLTDAERSKALAAARYQDAAYQASKTALNSWRGDGHERVHQSATAVRDALRSARYTGE